MVDQNKKQKIEGSCATVAMRQEDKIAVTSPTESKDGKESSWQKRRKKKKKKKKKRRATRRCAGRETRRYEKMGNWRRRRCATKRNTRIEMSSELGSLPDANTRASWSLESSPTNDGQYSFLPAPNSGPSFRFEYSPTKRRWIFLPSFLPSPDQRVELFSPVLGGSLFFPEPGTGGVKGVKSVKVLLGTVVSTLASLDTN